MSGQPSCDRDWQVVWPPWHCTPAAARRRATQDPGRGPAALQTNGRAPSCKVPQRSPVRESGVRSPVSGVLSPESGVRSPESRVQSPEPRAQSPEPRAPSPKPQAPSPKRQAPSPEPRAQSMAPVTRRKQQGSRRQAGRLISHSFRDPTSTISALASSPIFKL